MNLNKNFSCLFTLLFLCNLITIDAQNNWTWMNGSNTSTNTLPAFGTQGVSSPTNSPGSLFGAVTWKDNSGNLWLFGGYSVPYGRRNDMWKYNISSNQWTWVKGSGIANQVGVYGAMNTPSITNNPGARYLANSWTDNSGNFWMFGGSGYASSSAGALNDLWRYNPLTNEWTWMKGSNTPTKAGNYGTLGVTQSTTTPGSRYNTTTFKDNNGNLWLYGGFGYAATTSTTGYMNDLWKYDISAGNWTWMEGTNQLDQLGLYGTVTVATATNAPGGRRASVGWTDTSGDFWLFGGQGFSSSTSGLLNDLWKYNISSGNWVWMKGSNLPSSFGWYGTMGASAINNSPGSRYYSTAVNIDNQGNLWLFGGIGYSSSSASRLNDLWKYNVSTNEWTWMNGASSPNQLGVFGTQTIPSPTNSAGARYLHATWQDDNGHFWVYGGHGYTTIGPGYIEDMWKFDLCVSPATPLNTTSPLNLAICSGNTTSLTASSGSNTIRWYSTATSTAVLGTGSVFTTPTLTAVGSSSIHTYFAESYSCAPSESRTAISITVNPTPTLTVNSGTICNGGVFVLLPSGASTYTYSSGSQVVFPTSNTSYTITGTSANGCVAAQQAISQVTVHPSPVITVNSGTTCAGSPFVMVPSGASTYSFSSGTATVSPTTTTFYIVSGTSSLGCVSSAPAISSIQVYSTSPISVNNGSICPGGSFTITPSGALSYTYSGGSSVVSPSLTSTYSVSGSNASGCISTIISTVTVYNNPIISVNSGSICSGNSFTMVPSGASTYTYSSGSPIVTPTANASYFVTGTSSQGCVSSFAAISNVGVNSLPTISVANATICQGASHTFSPSGANTYTYSSGSAVVSPTVTTTYSVTGSSGVGCNAASPALATVFVNSPPSITVNSGTICAGNSFTLSPTGATSYTYSSGTAVVSPTTTTSYSVIATNSNGCVSSAAVSTVVVNPFPSITVNSGSICSGSSFSIIPSGGTSYSITGGLFVVSPTVNSTYTVTGISAAGCNASAGAISSVSVNTLPVISVSGGSVCLGNSFTLNPSGASSYTYSSGSAVITPSITSNYSVSGTSAFGCVSNTNAVATVSVLSLPVITVNSGSICAGNAFTITPSGASTYTYSGGSAIVTPTLTTTYSVTGTDSFGCISSAPVLANVAVSTTVNISVNSGSICSGKSFTLIPSGAASYTFSSGTAIVNPGISSTYTVIGTNTLGCISNPAIATVAVVNSPTLSVNSGAICSGSSFTLNPSGAITYTISGGSNVVSPTTNTVYSIVGTNAAGCVSSPILSSVTVNSLPIITVSSGSICSNSSYSIVASGATNYTYSGGSAVVSPSTSTVYTVIGSNSAGCVSAAAANSSVSVVSRPIISVNSGTICEGSTFTISPSGALTYTFSGGSAAVSPSSSTTYSVTGSNSFGCISASPAISSVSVLSGPLITVNSGSICSGSSFTLLPSGASSYTYSSGSSIVSPTSSSTYSISGTGANGCISTSAVVSTVVVNALPNIMVNDGSICSGQSFTLSPSGATTYTYSGGLAIVTPTANTSYTITGTNSLGCVSSIGAVANVTVNSLPIISVNSGTICSGNTFTLSPSGASNYTFSGGSAFVSPTVTTSYSVTGSSSLGCLSASPAVANISVLTLPVVGVNSGSICSGSSFTLIPFGASSYTYSSVSSVVNPTINTTYSVVGTGTNGCISTSAISSVTVINPPVISISNATVCLGNSYTLTPSGASSYTFSGGGPVVTPTVSSSYSIAGTNSVGCISAATIVSITVNNLPTVTVLGGTICPGNSYTINPLGASNYTFSSGSAIVSPTANSTYTVSGSDVFGCLSLPVTVTVVVSPILNISVNSGNLCLGDSYTLSPSGATSYTFSSGSPIVTPSVTTTYSVTGSSAGCTSTAVAVAVVSVVPLPTISVANGTVCEGLGFTLNPSGAASYSYSSGSALVTPSVSSSYTITGINSEGCISAPVIANIQVNQSPTITVNSGTICQGTSFTLNPSGALSYTYSGGSSVVTPTSSSSYTVSGTDANGCENNTPAISLVTVNQLPLITLVASRSVLCKGETSTLTASGAFSYSWSVNGVTDTTGTSMLVISPIQTNTYLVTGLNAEGCSNKAVMVIALESCTGIEPQTNVKQGIKLYPNPNVGEFTIEVGSSAEVKIMNEIGQIIYFQKVERELNLIDIKSYDNGIYFVWISHGNEVVKYKIIKQ